MRPFFFAVLLAGCGGGPFEGRYLGQFIGTLTQNIQCSGSADSSRVFEAPEFTVTGADDTQGSFYLVTYADDPACAPYRLDGDGTVLGGACDGTYTHGTVTKKLGMAGSVWVDPFTGGLQVHLIHTTPSCTTTTTGSMGRIGDTQK